MTYRGYKDKAKRKQFFKTYMRQKRLQEKLNISRVNSAISEVIRAMNIYEDSKILHGPEHQNDWKEGRYEQEPLVILNEYLISLLTQEANITSTIWANEVNDAPKLLEKLKICSELLEKEGNLLYSFNQLPSFQRRLNVSEEIAYFIAKQEHFATVKEDKALANWLQLINEVYKERIDAFRPELTARIHIVIDAKKKRNKPLSDDDKNFIESEKTSQLSETTKDDIKSLL